MNGVTIVHINKINRNALRKVNCVWKDHSQGYWSAECRYNHGISSADAVDNIKPPNFCPNCGGRIRIVVA